MGHGFSGFTVVFDINGCSSRSSDGLCLNLGYQISESKVLISVIKKNLLRNHGFFSFALVSCQIPFFLFQLLVGYKKAKPALWCLIWFIDGVSWTCMYQYIRRIIGWYFLMMSFLKRQSKQQILALLTRLSAHFHHECLNQNEALLRVNRAPKKQDKRRERASFILTPRHFGHGMKLCSIAISGLETVGIIHCMPF